jgi:hypothetical protein
MAVSAISQSHAAPTESTPEPCIAEDAEWRVEGEHCPSYRKRIAGSTGRGDARSGNRAE